MKNSKGRIQKGFLDNQIKNPDIQKWLLNLAIFCLAVVVVGFIFSMGKRLSQNDSKVEIISRMDHTQDYQLPAELAKQKPYLDVKVEVLNGCGVTGLAQRFTNYLRQEGFDVSYTGNADRMDYAKTHIIKWMSSTEKTSEVLNVLMLEQDCAEFKHDPSQIADFTLILGKDYRQLSVYSKILAIREHF